MKHLDVLKVFNALVVNPSEIVDTPDLSLSRLGVMTNFKIRKLHKDALTKHFEPISISTLFGRREREQADPYQLIMKQLLHYYEVYGLDTPGLFDLEVVEGKIIKGKFVRGITIDELVQKVQKILYTNAPFSEHEPLVRIIQNFKIPYEFGKIANNELRILMYDPKKDKFANGDDAVRYLVYKMTGDTLVIKNHKQIDAIKFFTASSSERSLLRDVLRSNVDVLSQVFNRFKPLLLAAKHIDASTINLIARRSKKNHKPVYEGFNKHFLNLAVKALSKNEFDKFKPSVARLGVRDKFKILNLIEYKKHGYSQDLFVIRNGTVHVEGPRKQIMASDLQQIEHLLLSSLEDDFKVLEGKNILLDKDVDYGLPISRKQSLGNLPFGTIVSIEGKRISAGIFWREGWGANDLDLTTVDLEGNRTGWGSYSGYSRNNPVTYSGDITWPGPDGAMEFMTSKGVTYGLFVNIYSGNSTSDFELVVGEDPKNRWIENIKVRERSTLKGRGSVIGFVEGTKFKVYQTKLNDRAANFGERSAVLNRATADMWTVRKLFDRLGIAYDVAADSNKAYDFDLTYSNFSVDKLESLLYVNA